MSEEPLRMSGTVQDVVLNNYFNPSVLIVR